MHFDQDGTYNLVYIAEDECGNTTLAERVVEVATYRTVLYPDGTFIINEKSTNQASNESRHGGTATNVYAPFDPNGETASDRYEFTDANQRPWHNECANILSVEIGSNIKPKSTLQWFASFSACTDFDFTNLDTSATTMMRGMFASCIALTTLDLSSFDTRLVANMSEMFYNCQRLVNLNLSSFDTSSVEYMGEMFRQCTALSVLDLSNFDTRSVINTLRMFRQCTALTTIYASSAFDISQATNTSGMFQSMSTNLVGGAGTTWSSSNPYDKTYAHIDGGTSNPGYFTAKA